MNALPAGRKVAHVAAAESTHERDRVTGSTTTGGVPFLQQVVSRVADLTPRVKEDVLPPGNLSEEA